MSRTGISRASDRRWIALHKESGIETDTIAQQDKQLFLIRKLRIDFVRALPPPSQPLPPPHKCMLKTLIYFLVLRRGAKNVRSYSKPFSPSQAATSRGDTGELQINRLASIVLNNLLIVQLVFTHTF